MNGWFSVVLGLWTMPPLPKALIVGDEEMVAAVDDLKVICCCCCNESKPVLYVVISWSCVICSCCSVSSSFKLGSSWSLTLSIWLLFWWSPPTTITSPRWCVEVSGDCWMGEMEISSFNIVCGGLNDDKSISVILFDLSVVVFDAFLLFFDSRQSERSHIVLLRIKPNSPPVRMWRLTQETKSSQNRHIHNQQQQTTETIITTEECLAKMCFSKS